MKKIYALAFSAIIFSSCSKDFLKPYDDRIIGTWHISQINSVGVGGSSVELSFNQGTFVFNRDGSLTYTDAAGDESKGSWDIQKRTVSNDVIRTLQITAINFNTEQVRTEFYDDMNFRSTDHFVAKVNTPFRSFVTHFKR